jgi:hypothetical protein
MDEQLPSVIGSLIFTNGNVAMISSLATSTRAPTIAELVTIGSLH